MVLYYTLMEFTTELLLGAQAHVFNLAFGYVKSMCLKAAIELGIADILHQHGKPVPFSELMPLLSIPPPRADSLRRLLRALVHLGVFSIEENEEEEEAKYALTPVSRLLVSSEPMAVVPYVRFSLDPVLWEPARMLASWIKDRDGTTTATTPAELLYGKGIWDVVDDAPGFNRLLNEGMASDVPVVMQAVLTTCSDVFSGLRSLVDVGGGNGSMARAIAEAFPEIRCTVLDLARVIDAVEKKTDENAVSYVAGNMFQSVPKADAALLKWILHDWSDEDCIKILKRCKEAILTIDNGGKVIIIDIVVGATTDNNVNALETQLLWDLRMMILTGGKERNEKEWQKIFAAAGFASYKIKPLIGIRSIIELYP